VLTRLRERGRRRSEPTLDELLAEIESLSEQNRTARDTERERRIMHLRQLAGIALQEEAGERPDLVEPDYDALPAATGLPEVSGDELTPELVRAAVLRHGAILVRGLVEPGALTALPGEIERAGAAHDAAANGFPDREEGYYQELEPVRPMSIRVASAAGVLAMDSPRVAFQVLELFQRAGLVELAAGYLRETPVLSSHKTTLRRVEAGDWNSWHQDGKFMGDVNALNVWISLSHCGDTAPGLDFVPRRLDHFADSGGPGQTGIDQFAVRPEKAEELAGDTGVVRPIFEPGDAVFFDGFYLHRPAIDPDMPNPRYAIESWFFGPSAFPEDYIPLAL